MWEGCRYENYQCTNGENLLNGDAMKIAEWCEDEGVTSHDYSLCGDSQVDLGSVTSDYQTSPDGVTLPKGTMCEYTMTYTEKFTDTINIDRDEDSQIFVSQTSDGVTTNLTEIQSRNLSGGRNLGSVTSSYAVTNADSVSITYLVTSDSPGSSFALSAASHHTPAPSTPTSGGTAKVESETVSNKKGNNNTPVILLVVSSLLLLVFLGAGLGLIWYKRSKKIVKSQVVANPNHVMVNSMDRTSEIGQEALMKLKNMKESEYNKDNEKFHIGRCVICLEDFAEGVKIRHMPTCEHIFHSGCIEKVLARGSTYSIFKCPKCNADI